MSCAGVSEWSDVGLERKVWPAPSAIEREQRAVPPHACRLHMAQSMFLQPHHFILLAPFALLFALRSKCSITWDDCQNHADQTKANNEFLWTR